MMLIWVQNRVKLHITACFSRKIWATFRRGDAGTRYPAQGVQHGYFTGEAEAVAQQLDHAERNQRQIGHVAEISRHGHRGCLCDSAGLGVAENRVRAKAGWLEIG